MNKNMNYVTQILKHIIQSINIIVIINLLIFKNNRRKIAIK